MQLRVVVPLGATEVLRLDGHEPRGIGTQQDRAGKVRSCDTGPNQGRPDENRFMKVRVLQFGVDDERTREIRSFEIRLLEVGLREVDALHLGPGEIGFLGLDLRQRGASQIRTRQIRLLEFRAGKVGANHEGIDEESSLGLDLRHHGATEVRAGKIGLFQIGFDEDGGVHQGIDENRLLEARRCEVRAREVNGCEGLVLVILGDMDFEGVIAGGEEWRRARRCEVQGDGDQCRPELEMTFHFDAFPVRKSGWSALARPARGGHSIGGS